MVDYSQIDHLIIKKNEGNPRYVAGMNGCELARQVLNETHTPFIDVFQGRTSGRNDSDVLGYIYERSDEI